MASPVKTAPPTALDRSFGESSLAPSLPLPGLSGKANSSTGNLLKGPIDDDGKLKSAALLVGIKLDLEAEVHLTARVRGDIDNHGNHNNHDYHDYHDALITGLFFLGGSKSDNGSEFEFGNIRVRLQTSSQGFVLGAGRESVSILQITLRFTLDFMDQENFGLDLENESTKKTDQNTTRGKGGMGNGVGSGMKNEARRSGDLGGEHSLSLSLTMTMTIMAVNTTTLS
ncbi:hypothetical protein E0Z10_g4748 [Xylaria hypoxylon]|uniref:Uncharacterized protein n=1 Tax=Xylaria hypoxylon TaxID=37992 RepID=A0A4Z0Z626_9PEZI|nr:hypothetical protein E0Z10_g4748 [Xylaria hypoxylon]